MKQVYVKDWEQFKRILDSKKEKIVYYTIDKYKRIVTVKYPADGLVFVYSSKPDNFPFECGILEEFPEEIAKFTKAEPVKNEIFGKEITYLVGAQKIRGFNLWCVYSDFSRTIKEEINRILSDYILIEGDIEEI